LIIQFHYLDFNYIIITKYKDLFIIFIFQVPSPVLTKYLLVYFPTFNEMFHLYAFINIKLIYIIKFIKVYL